MTNADKVRKMTDGELAWAIMCPRELGYEINCLEGSCIECTLRWLQRESEQNEI